MLPEKHLAWNNSGNFNFWEFILIFIKKTKLFENVREKLKKDEEYLKFIGIQGFNLYWLNNCCKHISPPPF
jgi:isocitrate lyase